MKIGIKYCGGCNPTFDRVRAVNDIMERYKGLLEFEMASKDSLYDAIVVVSGCHRQCASTDGLNTKYGLIHLDDSENIDKVADKLSALAGLYI